MACGVLILDKGKPVARPGRKAKGRPGCFLPEAWLPKGCAWRRAAGTQRRMKREWEGEAQSYF
jgi:hypothetical protein